MKLEERTFGTPCILLQSRFHAAARQLSSFGKNELNERVKWLKVIEEEILTKTQKTKCNHTEISNIARA